MSLYNSKITYDQSVYFDKNKYETNKASQLNNSGSSNNGIAWTAESVDAAFASVGLTPLEHYNKYGAYEGINPSDLLYTDAYYEAKAKQLTSTLGKHFTADDVKVAFNQYGLDPISHYSLYGSNENVFPKTVFASYKTVYSSADAIPVAGDNRVDSLVTTTAWLYETGKNSWNWNDLASSQGNTLYYYFPDSVTTLQDNGFAISDISDFQPFNQNQQLGAEQSLAELSSITGITFAKTSEPNKANIYMYSSDGGDAWGGIAQASSVTYKLSASVNNNSSITSDLRYGTNSDHQLIEHELGHVLDMKHPFQGSVTLPTAQDNLNYTIMSYTTPSDSWYSIGTSTYGPYDIAALQYMYGTDGLGGNQGFVHV